MGAGRPVTELMEEALTIFIGSMVVVALVKIPRLLAPRHYFAIHEIIHGMNSAVTWQAVAIRFSIPFIVVLAAMLLVPDSQPVVGIGIGIGFLSSLLLIWPGLLDRRLLPPQVFGRQGELYLVYAMFVASFSLVGLAAGFLGSYVEQPLNRAVSGEGAQKVGTAMGSQLAELAGGIVAGLVAAFLFRLWSERAKRLQ